MSSGCRKKRCCVWLYSYRLVGVIEQTIYRRLRADMALVKFWPLCVFVYFYLQVIVY